MQLTSYIIDIQLKKKNRILVFETSSRKGDIEWIQVGLHYRDLYNPPCNYINFQSQPALAVLAIISFFTRNTVALPQSHNFAISSGVFFPA